MSHEATRQMAGQIIWHYHYGFWNIVKCSKLIKVFWAESIGTLRMLSKMVPCCYIENQHFSKCQCSVIRLPFCSSCFYIISPLFSFPVFSPMGPMLTHCFSVCSSNLSSSLWVFVMLNFSAIHLSFHSLYFTRKLGFNSQFWKAEKLESTCCF